MSENQHQNTTRMQALEELCRQFRLALLYAFGSRTAELRDWLAGRLDALSASASDVDIGVKALTDEPWLVQEKVRCALALEDLFGCSRVDLVMIAEADPFLAAEIIRGERLFADNDYAADEYELYILRRAGDLIPLERERMALILGEGS
ncbi:MAG TPA: hypothetical protein PKM59_16440 [Thermodesulfobacteriota bacterium]|nr:hypothetical protein [Thermodesulfobacteriota bacterium]HNU70712.1 hypothetical protein [Thermodesulfobacteriota bacterium]